MCGGKAKRHDSLRGVTDDEIEAGGSTPQLSQCFLPSFQGPNLLLRPLYRSNSPTPGASGAQLATAVLRFSALLLAALLPGPVLKYGKYQLKK